MKEIAAVAAFTLPILTSCINRDQIEAISDAFGPASFDKGEYYYSFEGLRIAITEAVQYESGSLNRFRTYWAVVNRDNQRKNIAVSLDRDQTYILPAGTTNAIPVTATGIAACGRQTYSRYGRPGCGSYTTVFPGQGLTFILESVTSSGPLKEQAIGVRARFTIYEEAHRPAKSIPVNVDVEFNNISLQSAPWRPE